MYIHITKQPSSKSEKAIISEESTKLLSKKVTLGRYSEAEGYISSVFTRKKRPE